MSVAKSKQLEELLETWSRREKKLIVHKKELSLAEYELASSNRRLAEFLAPNDMKNGEVIGFWIMVDEFHERLLIVTKHSIEKHQAAWRGDMREAE